MGAARTGEIIRAIHDGSLGIPMPEWVSTAPADSRRRLLAHCRPDPARARELERLTRERQGLRPCDFWPGLKLIGCWLGGSAGLHARRLAPWYGPAAQRDLGLVASEGRITLPLEGGTAAGCLAVHRTFFEFIPEAEVGSPQARVLLVDELEQGQRYNLVLTGSNGLWRYDMNDLVEVRGSFGNTPTVAFVRKTRDVLSVTGEKVYVDQLQAAICAAERATGVQTHQYRLVADVEGVGHDLLVEFREPAVAEVAGRFLAWFDSELSALNCEYASKRKSRRLRAPRLYAMRAGWSERQCQEDFRRGKRELQYKWPATRESWDAQSREEVLAQVEL